MKLRNLVAAVVLMGIQTHSYAENSLTGVQIKELFANKTCDIEKVNVNNEKKRYLNAYTAEDGVRLVYIPWKNKTSERRWWVEDNKYCGSYPDKKGYCRTIVDAGNGVYHAIDNGEHIRTFSNFRDGNQL